MDFVDKQKIIVSYSVFIITFKETATDKSRSLIPYNSCPQLILLEASLQMDSLSHLTAESICSQCLCDVRHQPVMSL